jgi:hypothetical protein
MREIDQYLAKAPAALRNRALANAVRRQVGDLAFDISNLTEANFTGVEVEIVIPGPFVAYFEGDDAEDAVQALRFPDAPREWGRSVLSGLDMNLPFIRAPGSPAPPYRGRTENAVDGTTITFAPEDVRPMDRNFYECEWRGDRNDPHTHR